MKTIGILCGGFSSEYEISVKSARTIQENMPESYQGLIVEVQRDDWWVHWKEGKYRLLRPEMRFETGDESVTLDAVIIYIHGNPGENGRLQAYFDMIDFPYVNSGALPSALSFDKWFCNQFLKGFGIPVADSVLLRNREQVESDSICNRLGLPCFVKPADSGSSYGISRVNVREDLDAAIEKAFEEGDTVVIESFLQGTEVTCGVYRNTSGIQALPLTEIVTDQEFFDYEAKYLGKSQEITPARISQELTKKVQDLSIRIYELLQLASIARIDFMLVGDEAYVIEVNTTPGFSKESIVPKMIHTKGITIRDFWKEILDAELA
ncbi:MAG: D-alanine--D-alanine ligase [Bacteroidetes bacterium]|nr:MAG: D-alanine--D-alanine ligase [Bacteroidota bacterium]